MKTMNQRTFKRVFSLMLALIMTVGIFGITPVTANAAESRAVIQRYYPSTGSASGTVTDSATFTYNITLTRKSVFEVSYFFDAEISNCNGKLEITGPNYYNTITLVEQNVNAAYQQIVLENSGTYTFKVTRYDGSKTKPFYYSIILALVAYY